MPRPDGPADGTGGDVEAFEVLASVDETAVDEHSYKVAARGELDIETASQLSQQLDALISQGARLVVLDASEIEFVDSTGLRAVVAAANSLQETGGRLLIEGMSPAMARLLELSGLIDRFRREDKPPSDGRSSA
jgi:anti-anti-sigma factor